MKADQSEACRLPKIWIRAFAFNDINPPDLPFVTNQMLDDFMQFSIISVKYSPNREFNKLSCNEKLLFLNQKLSLNQPISSSYSSFLRSMLKIKCDPKQFNILYSKVMLHIWKYFICFDHQFTKLVQSRPKDLTQVAKYVDDLTYLVSFFLKAPLAEIDDSIYLLHEFFQNFKYIYAMVENVQFKELIESKILQISTDISLFVQTRTDILHLTSKLFFFNVTFIDVMLSLPETAFNQSNEMAMCDLLTALTNEPVLKGIGSDIIIKATKLLISLFTIYTGTNVSEKVSLFVSAFNFISFIGHVDCGSTLIPAIINFFSKIIDDNFESFDLSSKRHPQQLRNRELSDFIEKSFIDKEEIEKKPQEFPQSRSIEKNQTLRMSLDPFTRALQMNVNFEIDLLSNIQPVHPLMMDFILMAVNESIQKLPVTIEKDQWNIFFHEAFFSNEALEKPNVYLDEYFADLTKFMTTISMSNINTNSLVETLTSLFSSGEHRTIAKISDMLYTMMIGSDLDKISQPFKNPSFFETVCNADKHLTKMIDDGNTEAAKSRACLFRFLDVFVHSRYSNVVIFSNKFIVPHIISLLYEDGISEHVIEWITNCLQVSQSPDLIVSKLNDFLKLIIKDIGSKRAFPVISGLITAIKVGNSVNPKVSNSIKQTTVHITINNAIEEYSKTDNFNAQTLMDLMKVAILFLFDATRKCPDLAVKLEEPPHNAFQPLMRTSERIAIDEQTVNQLMAFALDKDCFQKKDLANMQIVYSAPLHLLIHWTVKSDFFEEIVMNLIEMTKFSIANRYQCFRANVISELIKDISSGKHQDQKENKSCILFSMIGSSFFHKPELVSTIKAIDEANEYSYFYVPSLIAMIGTHDPKVPRSFFHVSGTKNGLIIKDVETQQLTFSVTMKLFIYGNSNGNLFSITSNVLDIIINNNNDKMTMIIKTGKDKKVEKSTEIQHRIQTWTSISFKAAPDTVTLTIKRQFMDPLVAKVAREKKRSLMPSTVSMVTGMTQFDIEHIKFKTYGKTVNKVGLFSAKLMSFNQAFDVFNPTSPATFDGLAVSFSPSLIDAVVSCGGPRILLPLFNNVVKAEDPSQFLELLIKFVSQMLITQESIFCEQNFFVCLNDILKRIPDEYFHLGIMNQINSMYCSLKDEKLILEMKRHIWYDLSLVRKLPKAIPSFYRDNAGFLTEFGSMKDLLENIFNAFSNAPHDPQIELDVVDLIMIAIKELGLDGLDIIVSFLFDLAHVFTCSVGNLTIARLLEHSPNRLLEYLKQNGTFTPLIQGIVANNLIITQHAIDLTSKTLKLVNDPKLLFAELLHLTHAFGKMSSPAKLGEQLLGAVFHHQGKFFFEVPSTVENPQFLWPLAVVMTNNPDSNYNEIFEYLIRSFDNITSPYLLPDYLPILAVFAGKYDYMKWATSLATYDDVFQSLTLVASCSRIYGWDCEKMSEAILRAAIGRKAVYSDPEQFERLLQCFVRIPIASSSVQEVTDLSSLFNKISDAAENIILTELTSNFTELQIDFLQKIIEKKFSCITTQSQWYLVIYMILSLDETRQQSTISIMKALSQCCDEMDERTKKYVLEAILFLIKTIRSEEGRNNAINIARLICPDLQSTTNDEFFVAVGNMTTSQSDMISRDVIRDITVTFTESAQEFADHAKFIAINSGTMSEYFTSFFSDHSERMLVISSAVDHFDRQAKHRKRINDELWAELQEESGGAWSRDISNHLKLEQVTDVIGRHMRTKRNKKFNNHMDASKARDSATSNTKTTVNVNLVNFEKMEHRVPPDAFYVVSCQMLTLKMMYIGRVFVSQNSIFFEANQMVNHITERKAISTKIAEISSNDVRYVLWKRYQLIDCACEILTTDCHSIFFVFEDSEKRLRFIKAIEKANTPNLKLIQKKPIIDIFPSLKLTQQWKNGNLSNYEYLFWLNMFAGRSYNDISQYPVFPWVLQDYTSDRIQLSSKEVYRDLSKPVGTFNQKRLECLIEMKNEMDDPEFHVLYRTHYSSPAYTILYLLRLEPFTSLHIDLQHNRFDEPNRLFYSIPNSWRQINSNSPDFRELIPEFFTLPHFLVNRDKFDLGYLQNGTLVNDVELPPWAKSPQHFIAMNRLALESPNVSQNLCHWIDLIFGYKQRGKAAEEALNDFHRYSYYEALDLPDADFDHIRQYASNFGITPNQLFREPHPPKSLPIYAPICSSDALHKLLTRPTPILAKAVSAVYEDGAFYVIDKNGSVLEIKVHGSETSIVNTIKLPMSPSSVKHTVQSPRFGLYTISHPWSDHFDFVSADRKTPESNAILPSRITCMAGCGTHTVVAGCADSSLVVWPDATRSTRNAITGHGSAIIDVAFSRAVDVIASVDATTLIISSGMTGRKIAAVTLENQPDSVQISPMGLVVVIFAIPDGPKVKAKIAVYDTSGNKMAEVSVPYRITSSCIAAFPDHGEFILLCVENRNVVVHRLYDLDRIGADRIQSTVSACAFSKDDLCYLVCLDNDSVVRIDVTFE